MSTCYLIRGNVGKGKTSLAKKLAELGVVAIAADDMPGLYVDGKLDFSKQSEAHRWCEAQFEEGLKRGQDVAIHNTNVLHSYVKPYIEKAREYGYVVQIIHCEEVIFPNGAAAQSEHGVPQEVINRFRNSWEPWNPPDELGIGLTEVCEQLAGIRCLPGTLAVDMDGIKETRSGKVFAESPDDAVFLQPTIQFLSEFLDKPSVFGRSIWVVSNQRGVGNGTKSLDFLLEELLYVRNQTNLPLNFVVAPKRDSREVLMLPAGYEEFNSLSFDVRADKPGFGMLSFAAWSSQATDMWFIGNAHTTKHHEDWDAFQGYSLQAHSLEDLRYIPVEMLPLLRTCFE
jgi:predicted kinase